MKMLNSYKQQNFLYPSHYLTNLDKNYIFVDNQPRKTDSVYGVYQFTYVTIDTMKQIFEKGISKRTGSTQNGSILSGST